MKNKHESPLFILFKVIFWPFKSFLRILIVVIIVGLYIYQAVKIDQLAGEIRSLEVKRARLLNEKSNIETQIDQLTNINHIEKLAREKFDLVNSGKQKDYLVIKKFEPVKKSDSNEDVQLAGLK